MILCPFLRAIGSAGDGKRRDRGRHGDALFPSLDWPCRVAASAAVELDVKQSMVGLWFCAQLWGVAPHFQRLVSERGVQGETRRRFAGVCDPLRV